jgi:hypothetical protein
MSLNDGIKALRESKGWVSVEFVRATDDKRTGKKAGQVEKLVGRRNVKFNLVGGSPSHDAAETEHIRIWCPKKVGLHGPNDRGWREVKVENIVAIKVKGQEFRDE